MKFLAPDKLVPTAPRDSTLYDFNRYDPRPELIPITKMTNADYAASAQKKTELSTQFD